MRSLKRRARALISLFILLFPLAPASAAQVRYDYQGMLFNYTPPLNNPTMSNPYGALRVSGVAFFDDTVVTPNFTGTLLQEALLGPSGTIPGGTFTFANGQIVGWNLSAYTIL